MIGVYVVVAVGLAYLAGYVHAHLEASLNERGPTTEPRENGRSRRDCEAKHTAPPRSLSDVRRKPW